MLRFCGFSLAWISLCFFGVAGCGKRGTPGTDVSGKVSYNGKPVTGGSIEFHSKQGGNFYPGKINGDGSFSFKGIPVSGEVIVTVETESLKDKDATKMAELMKGQDPAMLQKMKDSMKVDSVYVPIPPKYGSPKTSPLTETLKGGSENHFDLVLKD